MHCRISWLVHATLWRFLRKYMCLKFKELLFVLFASALKFFFVSLSQVVGLIYIRCPVCGGLFLVQLTFFLIRLALFIEKLDNFFMLCAIPSAPVVLNVSLVSVAVLESALDLFDITVVASLELLASLRV